jgi:hypothetical protein
LRFADGAEVLRRGGRWQFLWPVRWPADTLRIEDAIARAGNGGGEVFTLPADLRWEDLLDRHLLRMGDRPVRLRLEFGGETVLLERRGEKWTLLPRWPVDGEALEDLLRNLFLLAFRDIRANPENGSRGELQLAIAIEGPFPDQRERLEFFQKERAAAVSLSGELFAEIAPDSVRLLLETCTRLRSRKIFQGLAGQRLLWRDGGDVLLVLERQGEEIAVLDPGGTLAISRGAGAVRAAERTMALRWTDRVLDDGQPPDLVLYGLDRPARELEVDGHRLLLGRPYGLRTYGYVASLGAIVAFETADIEEIAVEMARLAGSKSP